MGVEETDLDSLERLPLINRLVRLILALAFTFLFVYGVLPQVTSRVPILARMRTKLDSNGIAPSRYYYTDVDQVMEGEHYVRQAIRDLPQGKNRR
jgi:hypothetical protein